METGIKITIDKEKISDFCKRWNIKEFSFFGSVLRNDFHPDSDLDVLVSFSPDAHWGLFDMLHMQDELEAIFGRKVDIVSRRGVEMSRNPVRRKAILSSTEVIYASR